MISRAELNAILNDSGRLTKLLQRHVVKDLIYTSGLQGFQKAYALDFELLYIYHAKGKLSNRIVFIISYFKFTVATCIFSLITKQFLVYPLVIYRYDKG